MIAVGWNASDDRTQYEAARHLHHRHHRLWWVMWAPAARRFYAFYQGDAHIEPLADPTPGGLEAQIRRSLARIARQHPASFWRCPVSGCTWTSVNPIPHAPCPAPAAPTHPP